MLTGRTACNSCSCGKRKAEMKIQRKKQLGLCCISLYTAKLNHPRAYTRRFSCLAEKLWLGPVYTEQPPGWNGNFTSYCGYVAEFLRRETLLIFILNHDGRKDCRSHKTISLISKIAEAETKQKTQTSGNSSENTVCDQSKHLLGKATWHDGSVRSIITELLFEMTREINEIINSKVSMPKEN